MRESCIKHLEGSGKPESEEKRVEGGRTDGWMNERGGEREQCDGGGRGGVSISCLEGQSGDFN